MCQYLSQVMYKCNFLFGKEYVVVITKEFLSKMQEHADVCVMLQSIFIENIFLLT